MIDEFASDELLNEPGLVREGAFNLDCADNERDNCYDEYVTQEG